MLSVPADQSVKMRAEGRICVIVPNTSDHWLFAASYGLLYLMRHLQPCYGFHL